MNKHKNCLKCCQKGGQKGTHVHENLYQNTSLIVTDLVGHGNTMGDLGGQFHIGTTHPLVKVKF